MKNPCITFCISILLVISCSKDDSIVEPPPNEAEKFLNEVLDLMEKFSINRLKIDWQDFRKKVFDKVPNAQNIEDTYPGITEALILLEDDHSRFVKPDGSFIFVGRIQCGDNSIERPSFPENIGYIKVNSFLGDSDSLEALSFAEEIQNQIRTQDSANIVGWIVDLRDNGGGNLWPMLAGTGSILGEDIAGYLIEPDGNEIPYGFFKDSSFLGSGNPIITLSDPYELIIPEPKVAVLLDNGVASSGEAMAVSFIGRENTKSFGTSTCGLTTTNRTFTLNDNYRLILTGAYLADRNKNKFEGPVDPDEPSTNEEIIQKAVDWIIN